MTRSAPPVKTAATIARADAAASTPAHEASSIRTGQPLSAGNSEALFAGDQAFTFIGTGEFDGTAGQLRYEQVSITGQQYAIQYALLSGDTDGDGNADFEITVSGLHAFAASDFVL